MNTSGKEFASEEVADPYIARTIFFICIAPYKSAFDCSYNLKLIALTLPSPAFHAREVFQKCI